jgi:large subunit ribosomal protein L24
MQKKLHIKKGDTVKVISGESKGSQGVIISIDRKTSRAFVEGVNLVKRHTKPDAKNPQGGIVEKEAPLHISKLMLVVNGVPTRASRVAEESKKNVKVSKKSKEVIK